MIGFQILVAKGVLTDVDVETEHLSGRPAKIRMASLLTAEDVARETLGVHAVVVAVEPMPRSYIELLGPDVRLIARAGIGLDAIDLEAARDPRYRRLPHAGLRDRGGRDTHGRDDARSEPQTDARRRACAQGMALMDEAQAHTPDESTHSRHRRARPNRLRRCGPNPTVCSKNHRF